MWKEGRERLGWLVSWCDGAVSCWYFVPMRAVRALRSRRSGDGLSGEREVHETLKLELETGTPKNVLGKYVQYAR